jgi:dipeptidyl aminopeptidase/acylaminoacyl peptidase
MRRDLLLLALVVFSGPWLAAERPSQRATARFELTVDSIMRGPALVGYPPTGLRWSGDSKDLYFEWRRPGEDEASTYLVGREGGEPRRLSDEERKLAPPAGGGVWDAKRHRVLFVDEGDIVMIDSVARVRRQITRTTGNESNPRWARGDSHVTFTRDNNLFIVPLTGSGDLVVQLTDVAVKRPDPRLTESQKFLKEEEQKLIDHVREAAEKKKKDDEKREKEALPKFELKPEQSVIDLALQPGGEHVFMVVAERPDGSKRADVPNYVTESAYVEEIPTRSKVGDAQEKRRLAVLNLKTGKSVFASAEFAGKAPETSADRKPDAPEGGASSQAEKGLREIRWSMPQFSEDGRHAMAAARSADNEDRWLVLVDPDSGATRVVDHLHDEAWVRDGGGFGSPGSGWLPDNHRFWFLSERDGWMHLYVADASNPGGQPVQLTSGRFEISAAELSPDEQEFYLTTSEVHPGERHLYSLPVAGGSRTRITTMTGSNLAEVSPDEGALGLVYSYSNKPPEVYVMPNRPGAQATQVTTTPTEEWRSFKWVDPQLITFKARDGVDVYARLFTPEMQGARRDPAAPGVVFVHGAGYLQNAHKYWSTYYREYMFHNLLASRGYVVLDVDYRASAGYGRDWRTAIFRHMGGKDLDDIVDGAKYLAEKQKVSPGRIGVYGGSYGGFITLMALFTSPDTFAAGAALRPVTDWAHYNHGYTSNILNEPHADPEAYRRSSPIYHAQNLKGALLICHGMVDTNVHFQDSVRLAQRLIELRKENWELAVYPVENHGFERETSWADEYRRILRLFEDHLRTKRTRATD